MKRMKKAGSFIAGMLTMALIIALGASVMAVGSTTTLDDVMVGGIRIVVDGKELHPTDVNGKTVDPMIHNGTTYLPVRAVANALGKAVYWDGPNFTVYLGDMNGQLEYPTVMLKDMTSIARTPQATTALKDNYGNTYGTAFRTNTGYASEKDPYEYLLNMKYSRFKGTLYVPEGESSNNTVVVTISADGRQIYTSPIIDKTSSPINIDVNVTGYNDIKIEFQGSNNFEVCLADAGFYQ